MMIKNCQKVECHIFIFWISKMALHFMVKPHQDYCSAKVWQQKTAPVFVLMKMKILHDVQKLAKCGVPYFHVFDITSGIYFNQ